MPSLMYCSSAWIMSLSGYLRYFLESKFAFISHHVDFTLRGASEVRKREGRLVMFPSRVH